VFDVAGIELYFVGLFIFTALTHFTVNAERNDLLRLLMQHHNLKDFSYWASWMVWLTIINAIGVLIMIIAGLVRSFIHTNCDRF
jgi:amino acid permease